MEYEKIINLLDNTSNQPFKFRTKNWVKTNDDASEINDTQIDNANDTDIAMPIYNLIKNSNNYSKNQEVYRNATEMNHFQMLMALLLILLLIIITVPRLNLKQK